MMSFDIWNCVHGIFLSICCITCDVKSLNVTMNSRSFETTPTCITFICHYLSKNHIFMENRDCHSKRRSNWLMIYVS